MANMVALLRARGGFPLEEVAGAFSMSEKSIQALAVKGKLQLQDGTQYGRWTRQAAAREVRRFFDEHKRWPNSRDFRDSDERKKGLPSWEGLSVIMMHGYNPRLWHAWSEREDRQNQLREENLIGEEETLPDNGWVVLQRWMVLHEDLTPAEIMALPNTLIRRMGLEKYGLERMVREGFGEGVAEDDCGVLWKFPGERKDEPLMMVEVINSTPEPDGSFAHYFLRVPPAMTTPRQAVAWSFGVTDGWEDFKMVVET